MWNLDRLASFEIRNGSCDAPHPIPCSSAEIQKFHGRLKGIERRVLECANTVKQTT